MLPLVLYRGWRLGQHSRWSRPALLHFQQQELLALRRHAYQRSPFYREFHSGVYDRPLHTLPVITKQTLMDHFETVVTDPAVHIRDVTDHVEGMTGDPLFLGRYRVVSTSGTTGLKGLFLYDGSEWAWVMASYLRTFEWGGSTISLLHQQRMAIVSSLAPWHQSARVGLTAHSTFVESLRIDARASLPSIVEQLNSFQPSCLVGYADMVWVLAGEQGEGRLRIAPSAIYCASEPLRPQARAAIESVWGVQACNVYAATETAGIASQCEFRTGLHLYEDLIIPEVLDDDYHPVPVGEFGSRLVVTVLFSRTIPLIRYELSDLVAMSADPCPCGRPFAMLKDVQGRQEDMLQLPDANGHPIMIHPNLFHGVMEGFPLKQWQIVQEPGGLRVLIQAEANGQLVSRLRTTMATALSMAGATVQGIEVERIQEIQKTAIGKRKLIVAMSHSSASS